MATSKSDLYERIYAIVKKIPKGRVSSYGAIGDYVSTSPRVVGYAMNAAHTRKDVPAHRVVNRNGMLTGKHHFSTPYEMEEKLKKEGVKVKNDTVIDFEIKFWDPSS